MPPKAKIAAPIDRPLSRAYLREFSGWSTAHPPGLSDPASLRIMENVLINRDGSARIRPGMRYLSYGVAPQDATSDEVAEVVMSGAQRSTTFSYIAFGPDIQVGDTILAAANSSQAGPAVNGAGWTLLAEGEGHHPSYSSDDGPLYVKLYTRPVTAADIGGGVQGGVGVSILGITVLRNAAIIDATVMQCEMSTPTTRTIPAPAVAAGGTERFVFSFLQGGGGQWAALSPGSGVEMLATTNPTTLGGSVGVGRTGGYGALAPAWTINYSALSNNSDWPWVSFSVAVKSTVVHESTGDGTAFELPFVGTHEAFYLNDGTKAYLLAVRELDQTVGFRVLVVDVNDSTMYDLEDPFIDFEVRQTRAVLNFSSGTTYVKYLQIDNKIFALSDNGEPMRVFAVGAHKTAKALASITRPEWQKQDKLDVVHPDAAWINGGEPTTTRRNRLPNPSFETNLDFWKDGTLTKLRRPASPPITPVAGERVGRLESLPTRTNLATSPLHNVNVTGIAGWGIGTGDPQLQADGDWLKVMMPAKKGSYYGHTKFLPGIDGGTAYRVAFGYDDGAHIDPKAKVRFFGVNGAQVGDTVVHNLPNDGPRFVSPRMIAPKGAVSARLSIGGDNLQDDTTNIRIRNVVLCEASEDTSSFHGGSGTDYFWTGQANDSASVYHPPADVALTSELVPVRPGKALSGSLYLQADTTVRSATFKLRLYDKNSQLLTTVDAAATPDVVGSMTRLEAGSAAIPADATQADIRLVLPTVARGEYHYVDAAMIEADASVAGTYFDGATTDVPTAQYTWTGKVHASPSVVEVFSAGALIPDAETPTADTLRATGGRAANPYSFGFFYTFNNEVGESAASKVTVFRVQRAWSSWAWETPNAAGEPSGTETNDAELSADQLVAIMPEEVFNEAMAQGAISWSLYMLTWSDQDAQPVVALKVGERELPPDAVYGARGWIRMTPGQVDITDEAILPSLHNRYNYSDPSRAGQGLVAADRMILVNDPSASAVIRWSSNLMGEYTNFTASKGGGYKTLTSGNLYVPAAVKLWQNPQSADTLTILCLGTDGYSTSYYMAPAQVTSQSDATSFMGFEETTATAGTTSPYGVEVFNNALYHPLDDQLVKSTASNYNISHKSLTDEIANKWERLATKYWIMSSQYDGRLYYLVNNPDGEPLEVGCKGNEVWVYDALGPDGSWSRFLIQALTLRKVEFGGRIYMSVIRPDGVYYLDPEYGLDDVVGTDLVVGSAPIPWKLETNIQGANRAHDAWAHLQQVTIGLGNFLGTLNWGVRGWDVHGRAIDVSKLTHDNNPAPTDGLRWDIEDFLKVQCDMKEWRFYAESVPDVASSGQVSLVQYRYAPVSVNVGYEYGSVETFEYARNAVNGNDAVTANGVPVQGADPRRP